MLDQRTLDGEVCPLAAFVRLEALAMGVGEAEEVRVEAELEFALE